MLNWLLTPALAAAVTLPHVIDLFHDPAGCQLFLGEIRHPVDNDTRHLYWIPLDSRVIHPLTSRVRAHADGTHRVETRDNHGANLIFLTPETQEWTWRSPVGPYPFRRPAAGAKELLQRQIFARQFAFAPRPRVPRARIALRRGDADWFIVETDWSGGDVNGIARIDASGRARALGFTLVPSFDDEYVDAYDLTEDGRSIGRLVLPFGFEKPNRAWFESAGGREQLDGYDFDYEMAQTNGLITSRHFPPSPFN